MTFEIGGWGGGGGQRSLVGGRFQLAADATPWGGHSPSATGEVKVVCRGSALGARPMGGRDLGGCRHILFGSLVLCAGRIRSAVVAVACTRARSAPGSLSPTSPKQWLAHCAAFAIMQPCFGFAEAGEPDPFLTNGRFPRRRLSSS